MLPPINVQLDSPPPTARATTIRHDEFIRNGLAGTWAQDSTTTLPTAFTALCPLNFQRLAAFETVTQQFDRQGLEFIGAIALAPSNPRFIEQSGQKVLMPAQPHQLELQLSPSVQQIGITGRSTQPILLEVIDATNAVTTVQNGVISPLAKPSQHDTGRLPAQILKLETPAGGRLRLSAKAPFVISTVAIAV